MDNLPEYKKPKLEAEPEKRRISTRLKTPRKLYNPFEYNPNMQQHIFNPKKSYKKRTKRPLSVDSQIQEKIKCKEIEIATCRVRGEPAKLRKTGNTNAYLFCSICFKVKANGEAINLTCFNCNSKAHKTKFINNNLFKENWFCDILKVCALCYEQKSDGDLITCSGCAKSYHTSHHKPPITHLVDEANWECAECSSCKWLQKGAEEPSTAVPIIANKPANSLKRIFLPLGTPINEIDEFDEPLILDTNVPRLEKEFQFIKCETTIDIIDLTGSDEIENLPNVSDWTCEKLALFMAIKFPAESGLFIDHNIDGSALMLLPKENILSGLGLKLGPALRLYGFILKLQNCGRN